MSILPFQNTLESFQFDALRTSHIVFLAFSNRHKLVSQSSTWVKADVSFWEASSTFFAHVRITASSAYIWISTLWHTFGISFTCNENKIGPSMESCGTPNGSSVKGDLAPSTVTHCVLFDRYNFIRRMAC